VEVGLLSTFRGIMPLTSKRYKLEAAGLSETLVSIITYSTVN
jgi:hypothetical protein